MMKASRKNAMSSDRPTITPMLSDRILHLSCGLRSMVMANVRPGNQMRMAFAMIQFVNVNSISIRRSVLLVVLQVRLVSYGGRVPVPAAAEFPYQKGSSLVSIVPVPLPMLWER